eukprot:15449674-Alexandrium_andersonii.AAC.1
MFGLALGGFLRRRVAPLHTHTCTRLRGLSLRAPIRPWCAATAALGPCVGAVRRQAGALVRLASGGW